MQISLQLYSVRDALAQDHLGTLRRLVEMGFDTAEPYHLVEQRDDLVRAREELGIAFPSAHQSFLGDGELGPVLEAARAVGVRYLVDPFWNPEDWTDAGAVRALADRLNRRAAEAAGSGITVGYHNHHFELASQLEGRSALELFADELEPGIVLEIDTYWAVVGGADITALLGALGERVKLVHLKDGDLAEDPAGQLPLGEGRMPLAETLAASRRAELGVIEFDAYAGDIFEGVAASRTHLLERR
ncbi:xylose isomerase [Brachybacterium phenoliresistens]|uniref:Xylose isomerase n=1 Tax=Brachybacterium phenoliresistens TaxID=396014 RepID=Z9JVH8_9MICO|nr:sugar phosphate isomerase/epimerase [Brachybacterium phenoliresistens]EWS82380.1 xylose isomerase [Brachybacterium phenoliresistens]